MPAAPGSHPSRILASIASITPIELAPGALEQAYPFRNAACASFHQNALTARAAGASAVDVVLGTCPRAHTLHGTTE